MQALRRLDTAIIDFVENLAPIVAFNNNIFDVLAQLFNVAFRKSGSVVEVLLIYGVVQGVVVFAHIVVQVCAGPKSHVGNLGVFVVILDHFRIAPSLIGGMHYASVRSAGIGFHQAVQAIDLIELLPLLELDDYNVGRSIFVVAGNKEVYTFGGVGQVVLDGHA